MSYSLREHGSSFGSNFGNLIFTGDCRAYRPSWDKTETVLRIIPPRTEDGSGWEPFRFSNAPMDFGDWIRHYPAVRSFGENESVTMLLHDPANGRYDETRNPCFILWQALSSAVRNKTDQGGWAGLLQGGAGRSAACGRPTAVWLARAAIFRHKSEDKATSEKAPLGLAEDDKAHFIELSESAGKTLMEVLETRNATYQSDGGEIDYDKYYMSGDVVDIYGGAFIHFFTAGHDPRNVEVAPAASGPRQLTVARRGEAATKEMAQRFACFTAKEWKGYLPDLSGIEDQLIRKNITWDRALVFLSYEEQAIKLQEGNRFPANLLLYAFRDHPSWVTTETRDRAANRTTATVGTAGQETMQRTPVRQAQQSQSITRTPGAAPKWGTASAEESVENKEVDPAVAGARVPQSDEAAVNARTSAVRAQMDKAKKDAETKAAVKV